MSLLTQLAESRLSQGLDAIIAEFAPGQALPARLVAGNAAALSVLRKYRPDFRVNGQEAKAQARDIDAWADRHQRALEEIMASSADRLPAQLQLEMGNRRAQAFFLATYAEAAAGLPAWTSGAVKAATERPGVQQINERFARIDAQQRLEMFALIVKLDREGALEQIFVEPGDSVQGLGAIPLWFVAVVLVIVAAALVTAVVLLRRVELNNRLLRELCRDAVDKGDTDPRFAMCVEAATAGQKSAIEDVPKAVALGLMGAAGVYAGMRYVLPWAVERLASRR